MKLAGSLKEEENRRHKTNNKEAKHMRAVGSALIFIFIFFFCYSISYAYAPFGRALCKAPGFACVKVPKRNTWETLFPDANQRMLVMTLNRMNTPVYSGMLIAVPTNLTSSASLMDFSPFPGQISPLTKKTVFVDPAVLAWGAYDTNGRLVRWGPASLGSDWCHDLGHRCHSPVGSFAVYQKGSYSCRSTKFPLPHGGAPMPYCMYFHGGFALHGEPGGLPGDNVSHGCVRLLVGDAEWLSKQFVDVGTAVIVGPYGKFTNPQTSHFVK